MRKKVISRIIFILLHSIGFVLLYFILRNLDWTSFLKLLVLFPLWKFFLGLAMLMAVYLLKTLRWYIINKSFDIHIPFSISLTYFLVAGFLSAITPGRLGEFSKIYFMNKKQNISITQATSSVIMDRIWDVMVLSLMAISTLVFLLSGFDYNNATLIVIFMFFLVSFLIIVFPSLIFIPALRLSQRWTKVHDKILEIKSLWSRTGKTYFIPSFLLSLAAFLFLSAIPLLFAPDVNAHVPISASIGAVSLSNILSFLPISVAGFGTREFVFTRIWAIFSHGTEAALSISTAQFLCTYVGSILIGGLVYLLRFRRHFSFREIREETGK